MIEYFAAADYCRAGGRPDWSLIRPLRLRCFSIKRESWVEPPFFFYFFYFLFFNSRIFLQASILGKSKYTPSFTSESQCYKSLYNIVFVLTGKTRCAFKISPLSFGKGNSKWAPQVHHFIYYFFFYCSPCINHFFLNPFFLVSTNHSTPLICRLGLNVLEVRGEIRKGP